MFWIQTRNALSILLFHCLLIFRAISFYFELCRGSPLFYEEENIYWKIRTDALVTALSFFHNLGKLDPFQTSNFTCAESNTNERKQYIFLICTSWTFETGLKSHAAVVSVHPCGKWQMTNWPIRKRVLSKLCYIHNLI